MTRRHTIALLAWLTACGGAAGGGGGAAGAGAGGDAIPAAGGSGRADEPRAISGASGASVAATAGLSSAGGAMVEMAGGGAGFSGHSAAPSDSGAGGEAGGNVADGLPPRARVLDVLRRANDYFLAEWPDPAKAIDSSHSSLIWTRAVYYEGLLALYAIDPRPSDLSYAVAWGTSHDWGLNGGTTTRSADNQCAGQTYLDLYRIEKDPARIADIQSNIDFIVSGSQVGDWTWVDALQMAMPAFAKLGALSGQSKYYEKMYAMYASAKNAQGAAGFYSQTDHLWWRDADFDPPYAEPNGKNCFWSRGNGWAFAALTRVLDTIPANEPHRPEYLADFRAMAEAVRAVQRPDGFWNVSLQDPTHFGGPELTGTSLFVYGLAWGVRTGVLPADSYRPVIEQGFRAMTSSVHDDGFLGYVQGTGKQPSDGQPVTFDKRPNYEDFGLGCFLLGGSEVARLAEP